MDIKWKRVGTAGLLGLIPAFVAYVMASIAGNDVYSLVFFVAIPVFGYLLYRVPTVKEQAGQMFFWLAIETLLTPLVLLVSTFVFTGSETAGGAETAGAVIGGGILIIAAFLIGIPLAGVFYLISRRLG